MKKTLIVLGVILVFALSGYAQTEGIGLTGKGIKAGVNLANLTGSDVSGVKMNIVFGGGAFVEYSFSPQLAVQPEALFMMKGAKAEEGSGKFKFSYIEVPVLLKFKPAMEGNFKPAIFAGPAVSFLMSAKFDPGGDVYEFFTGDTITTEQDIKDDMKSVDFGVAFGAGFTYMMQNGGGVTFDARYTLGLAKIYDTTEDVNVKNGVFSFMVGYSF